MKHIFLMGCLVVGLSAQPALSQPTAFVNANVVPMDRERVLEAHTVIIEAGRITQIGPSDTMVLPEDTRIIDATGGWLMPGFADMHVHLEMRDSDPRSLLLYLAEGTTTVRSTSGRQMNLDWRDAVERGELLGPTIATAGKVMFGLVANTSGHNQYVQGFRIATAVGPFILGALVLSIWGVVSRITRARRRMPRRRVLIATGGVLAAVGFGLYVTKTPPGAVILPYVTDLPGFIAETPQQAVAEVRRQHAAGVDFIKVYDSMTIPEYLAAIDEAKRLGIYVVGHALDEASLEVVMTSGVDEIAHLDELNFYHWRGAFMSDNFSLDYQAIPATAALMKDNNVNIVSNLSLDEALVDMIFAPEETLARPEYRVVRPQRIEFWRTEGRQTGPFAQQGSYRRDMEFEFFLTLVKSLHDAGVIVTTGTDVAPFTEGSLPSHIHREFELLARAGLSNFDALSAGTRNAGLIFERMGADGDFGTVEIGQRADLVLLRTNPLESVSATRDRLGVMLRGQWLLQAEIDMMVDNFISSY